MGQFGVGVVLGCLALLQAAVHAQSPGPLSAPDCATDAVAAAAAKKHAAAKPPVGDPEAGRKHWAFGNSSCLNCHGAEAQGAFAPTLAGRNFSFDLVRNQIRRPCGIMPAFVEVQLTDQEIADMLAFWNSLTAKITPSGNTYTIDVINSAVKGKGSAADDVNVSIALPANVNVVSATGTGYQGLQPIDNTTKLAVFRLARLEPAVKQALTLVLSAPAPNLRGTIKWAKPAVKADQIVTFSLSRGGRGLQATN